MQMSDVTAFATLALAAIGGWYAWETHRVVERMDWDREARERPILTFELVPWQARLAKLRIRNVGAGIALGISGEMAGVSTHTRVPVAWSYPALAPGGYEEFGFPTADEGDTARFSLDEARGRFVKLEATFDYRAASGLSYKMHEEIDIAAVTDDWFKSRMLATEDHPQRLGPRLARTLEQIRDRLQCFRRAFPTWPQLGWVAGVGSCSPSPRWGSLDRLKPSTYSGSTFD
jgi:hypothetical protein